MPQHNRDTLHWESYNGRKILIKDLEVQHLVNILNHIQQANESTGRDVYGQEVLVLMEAEAELRIMIGWASNKGIPRKTDNGWIVINQSPAAVAIENLRTFYHKQKLAAKVKSLAGHA